MLLLLAMLIQQPPPLQGVAHQALTCGARDSNATDVSNTSRIAYFLLAAARAAPAGKPLLDRVTELAQLRNTYVENRRPSFAASLEPSWEEEEDRERLAACQRQFPNAYSSAAPRLPADRLTRDIMCTFSLGLLQSVVSAGPAGPHMAPARLRQAARAYGARLTNERLRAAGIEGAEGLNRARNGQLLAMIGIGNPETVSRACLGELTPAELAAGSPAAAPGETAAAGTASADTLCGLSTSPPDQIVAACDRRLALGRFDSSRNEPFLLYASRGNAYYRAGNGQAALRDANEAIGLNPASEIGYGVRGFAHLALEQYPAALADFDKVLQTQASQPDAMRGRINALLGLKRYADAAQAADRFAAAHPQNADANNLVCWINGAHIGGDLDRARRHCDTAVRLQPNEASFLDSRALVALKQGRFEDAWRDYDVAVRKEPGSALYLFGRGVAALRAGRTNEGNADLAAARRLDPAIERTYADYGVAP